MPLVDSNYSNLEAIQTKVRRLTRSPSPNQLSNTDLNNYINTFVLYDMPESIRLFNLRSVLTFYTQPNIDTYSTNTTVMTDPLYNFINKYTTVHPPVYVAGIEIKMCQSRNEFYQYYPQNMFLSQIGAGDGTTTTFSGTFPYQPVLQNEVLITSIDANNNGLSLIDYPVSNEVGALGIPGIPQTIPSPYGQVNYINSQVTATFDAPYAPPAQGQAVNAQVLPYIPAQPTIMLFFDGNFVFRPVPDQVYQVQMDVWMQPTELLSSTQTPNLQEWWQYIAYGASKKLFEDRMDLESVQQIAPEFNKQERLILRRTLVQYSNQRSATIFQHGNSGQANNANNYWGGTF